MLPNKIHNNLSEQTIREALSFIDPNCDRDEWARIAMALKAELGESGYQLFDEWSQAGDSYDKRDCRDTWRSVRAHGGVTIGSLIHAAQQSGFRLTGRHEPIPASQVAERKAKREAEERREAEEVQRRRDAAESIANELYAESVPAASHPYLERKGVSVLGDLRIGQYRRWYDDEIITIDNALLVPVRDADKRLRSLQAYFPDANNPLKRDRDYLPGGQKAGCYFVAGKATGRDSEVIAICEGLSTGLSIVMSGAVSAAVIAFDSGNLPAVAPTIRSRLPRARLIVCADDDRFGKINAGKKKAIEAALASDADIAFPSFAAEHDELKPTDFNDLHQIAGLDEVKRQILAASRPTSDTTEQPAITSEFGHPIDVFGVQPPPEMPLDLLPRVLVDYVADQADLLGADPAIVGLSAIVSAAAAITDGIKLQPKRYDPTWTESARLWVAFVGDPSTKKSPAISKAVRHIKRIDIAMCDQNSRLVGDYKFQLEQHKEAKKANKGGDPLPEPQAPQLSRLMVEDVTVEALSEVLRDNPRGVLCLKDELTGWFASMDAYKGSGKGASMDRAHWLEAYNGGRRTIDRVGRGSFVVPNWSVSMIGGIQGDMIRRIAANMGNDGLLQRFIVICARPAKRDIDRKPDMDAMRRYSELFDHLAALKPCDDPVLLSPGAHEARERVSDYSQRLVNAIDHPHLRAWLGKWDGLYSRLLLTYHILDCAAARVFPTDRQVSSETAQRVERLMFSVLLPHALHFYQEVIDAGERQEHIRQIARLILARGIERLTKRDLLQMWKPGRAMEWWQARGLLDSLCTMDWLDPDLSAIDIDGKPRAWFVNPAVHTAFGQLAEVEKERRKIAADAIREMREVIAAATQR